MDQEKFTIMSRGFCRTLHEGVYDDNQQIAVSHHQALKAGVIFLKDGHRYRASECTWDKETGMLVVTKSQPYREGPVTNTNIGEFFKEEKANG